ncbi:PAP2 family protein [Bifidobacterium leontopitheci]|uniref:PAP2 family protein n=2 Tax=Bifidobacterium leontopitheci TaxID=2650774 RepID=A0A6I1GE54_9BIFI|nr:PAP2 family protein [Bifidobacterium leontopitheci]
MPDFAGIADVSWPQDDAVDSAEPDSSFPATSPAPADDITDSAVTLSADPVTVLPQSTISPAAAAAFGLSSLVTPAEPPAAASTETETSATARDASPESPATSAATDTDVPAAKNTVPATAVSASESPAVTGGSAPAPDSPATSAVTDAAAGASAVQSGLSTAAPAVTVATRGAADMEPALQASTAAPAATESSASAADVRDSAPEPIAAPAAPAAPAADSPAPAPTDSLPLMPKATPATAWATFDAQTDAGNPLRALGRPDADDPDAAPEDRRSRAERRRAAKNGAKGSVATAAALNSTATAADEADIERGLARRDPLTVRPRVSSRVLCAVFGVLLVVLAFVVWWFAVRTEDGQSYEDLVFSDFDDSLPAWASALASPFVHVNLGSVGFVQLNLTVIVSLVVGVAALATAAVRKRWWLLGQSAAFVVVCFAATYLKELLPRPFIINTDSQSANSAPSGHTMLAAAAVMLLVCAVPRVARAWVTLVGAAYAMVIGFSVIAGGWHRTSDVVMGLLLVGAFALLTLAFTRTSGMDEPGSRASSASVQIVGTVMITGGLLACVYALYLIWQIQPGLSLSASWASAGAHVSTFALIGGTSALVFGLALAMRQLTASPLSRAGLVGAPPAPPKQRKAADDE